MTARGVPTAHTRRLNSDPLYSCSQVARSCLVPKAAWAAKRMILVARKFTEADDWHYLPPSKANLARLRVPAQPGYPRSG